MIYAIYLTKHAKKMLSEILDKRIQNNIKEKIDALSVEPDKQGKALAGHLAGLRSIRAAGQRYRIIYKVLDSKVIVIIAAIGLRKDKEHSDIYALAKKLLKLGLVE